MIRLAWVLMVGCGTNPKTSPTPTLTTPPIPSTPAAADTACMDECERRNMARAVSADTIKEQCARECDPKEGESKPVLLPEDLN